jgi:hypothetical protein
MGGKLPTQATQVTACLPRAAPGPGLNPAQAADWRNDHRMYPDQGSYQERYRLTGTAARSLGISVAFALPAAFTSHALPWLILSLAAFALITVPCLIAVASRKIAFRADQAGITLGADPLNWPFRHASAVFIPWADAERIVLYHGPHSRGWGAPNGSCIGIQRRQGAPALSRGNQPARRCPVPGVAAGAARPVTAWRLDRDRLAALTAAVVPAIPIIDASTGPNPSIEAPASNLRPSDR